jgi:DnaJ-class molecular chaperone
VKRKGKRGDLLVELRVHMPDRADEKLAKALRDANSAYSHPLRSELSL